MPCYPALALLLGSAMAAENAWVRGGTAVLTALAGIAAATAITILLLIRNVATPGDIFTALTSHPSAYTLSLGHMEDLTLQSFAYLRTPLLLAAIAFLIGAIGTFRAPARRAFVCVTLMMMLFFQAARLALITFDPDLSSKTLAEAILHSPDGKLIVDRHYYAYSSVFFYTNRTGLLLNGRRLNLSYGSYAPGAPDPFIDDAQFKELWSTPQRYYLVASDAALQRLEPLVGRDNLNIVAAEGGKFLATNLPLPSTTLPPVAGQHAERNDGPPMPSDGRSSDHLADRSGAVPHILSFVRGIQLAPLWRAFDWRKPAIVAQTRYILKGRNLLAIHRTCLPNDRVDLAVREPRSNSSSISGAALHMSPEEDA